MDKLLDIPHFDNEDQEANWWFENRDQVTAAFERAAKEGRLRRGSGAIAALLSRQGALNLRIAGEDLATIRKLASGEGQPEEVYAAALLHKALQEQKRRNAG
jgi:predicted DNA binding CopG/RHH family protein